MIKLIMKKDMRKIKEIRIISIMIIINMISASLSFSSMSTERTSLNNKYEKYFEDILYKKITIFKNDKKIIIGELIGANKLYLKIREESGKEIKVFIKDIKKVKINKEKIKNVSFKGIIIGIASGIVAFMVVALGVLSD